MPTTTPELSRLCCWYLRITPHLQFPTSLVVHISATSLDWDRARSNELKEWGASVTCICSAALPRSLSTGTTCSAIVHHQHSDSGRISEDTRPKTERKQVLRDIRSFRHTQVISTDKGANLPWLGYWRNFHPSHLLMWEQWQLIPQRWHWPGVHSWRLSGSQHLTQSL